MHGLSEFPENRNFNQFLTLFDSVNWRNYAILSAKLKDDDIFIDFLQDKFPETTKKLLRQNFDHYIERLATQEKIENKEFVRRWIRNQLVHLVDVLNGKKRPAGSLKDLEDSLKNCAKILAYLHSLKESGFSNSEEVEFEDVLLKLAIEGGNYCARGIKRASGELINNVLHRGLEKEGTNLDEPVENYEIKIGLALQEKRRSLISATYNELALFNKVKSVKQDVHSFDIYRIYLSLGCFPLTEHERSNFGLLNFLTWRIYSHFRVTIYKNYFNTLDEAIESNGEAHFAAYIRQIITFNRKLSDVQKGEILEMYTECNNGTWDPQLTRERFHQLMFVMQGVLIPR